MHPIAAELSSLVNILAGESDRGLALTGAAMLDDALAVLLKSNFLEKPKVVNSIIGLERPLGTFSSRIKMAYILGLLVESEYRDLDIVRKIRNDCAHSRSVVDFNIPPHKDRIAELQAPKEMAGLLKSYFDQSFSDEGESSRNQLLVGICILGAWLIFRPEMVKRPTIPNFYDMKRRAFEKAKNQEEAG